MLVFAGDRVPLRRLSQLHQRASCRRACKGPDEPGIYRWSEWSKDHPIFEPFDQPEHGDLRGLTFARITRLGSRGGSPTLVGRRKAAAGRRVDSRPGTMRHGGLPRR